MAVKKIYWYKPLDDWLIFAAQTVLKDDQQKKYPGKSDADAI